MKWVPFAHENGGSRGYWCFIRRGDATYQLIDAGDRWLSHYVTDYPPSDCGPPRKTLQAAVNDCIRHSRKLRADLVEFSRIGVPE